MFPGSSLLTWGMGLIHNVEGASSRVFKSLQDGGFTYQSSYSQVWSEAALVSRIPYDSLCLKKIMG